MGVPASTNDVTVFTPALETAWRIRWTDSHVECERFLDDDVTTGLGRPHDVVGASVGRSGRNDDLDSVIVEELLVA